jgi:hypothetical protein
MDDAERRAIGAHLLVCVMQTRGRGRDDRDRVLELHAPALTSRGRDDRGEILAVDVLHREVVEAVDHADVVDLHDARVMQRGERACRGTSSRTPRRARAGRDALEHAGFSKLRAATARCRSAIPPTASGATTSYLSSLAPGARNIGFPANSTVSLIATGSPDLFLAVHTCLLRVAGDPQIGRDPGLRRGDPMAQRLLQVESCAAHSLAWSSSLPAEAMSPEAWTSTIHRRHRC